MTTNNARVNSIDTIIEKTIEYVSIPAVVGHEQVFLRYLRKDFKMPGVHIRQHPGVLEISGKKPDSQIVCAHVDRHGLISIGNNEYAYAAQYIKEIKYGEQNLSSRRELENIAGRFNGEDVYAYNRRTGARIAEGIIEQCDPAMAEGDAVFHVRGMKISRHGTPLAYLRKARQDGDYLRGQIDNAISVAVVHTLFAAGYQGTALLTTEEEIGKSWRHIANYLENAGIQTRNLFILDTSPYADREPVENGTVVLRNRDFSEIFNADLVERLAQRCTALGLPFHKKDEYLRGLGREISQLGSTELGRLIQNTNDRWSGATVQIPTLMYHTSNETTSRLAISHFFRFLHNILIEDRIF